ncbi:hypothetical protein DXG03_006261 [Asterophora parasitica]|uniref:Cytochrome P450 n=1 Tax=Asterophora parasitica TaxID=117018 RepID=A0A9P7G7B8_9AGAR|nr:hypothetical protein DXG03_006261 [Asterophora parasitica]
MSPTLSSLLSIALVGRVLDDYRGVILVSALVLFGPPSGHLIYGQFPAIIKGEAGIPQREWVKEYGPVVRAVGPLGIERLIFMKPDALHKILVSDWVDYPRPGFMRHILGLIAGYGLLTVTGNEHKQMRKFINPAFSIPGLVALPETDMYYDPIESLIKIMQTHIDSEKSPDVGKEFLMYEWMSKVTLDIICETAFGYRTDSLHDPHNDLAEAYEKLISMQTGPNLARFIAIMVIPGVPQLLASDWAYRHRHWFALSQTLARIATLIESMHRIKQISATILAEKMQASVAISDTDTKRDVMSLLVHARKADPEKDKGYAMSDEVMMDQVLTFLGAGHETTASGLAWTLWLLANDQESQARLREEVTPLLSENPRPDYRSLKDLQWLDCVVMESLRVLPPVPMTFRSAAKTDYIDGVLVPKGTILYIPVCLLPHVTPIAS